MTCKDCKYSQLLAEEGEQYVLRNPVGDEITRAYESNILICRWFPPVSGQWPQVSDNDFCSKFENNVDIPVKTD